MSVSRKLIAGLTLIALLSLTLLINPGRADEPLGKLGFVDLQEVFEKSAKFQRVRDEIKQEMQTKSDKIKQLDEQFRTQLNDFKVKRDLLPSDKAKERQEQLQNDYRGILGTIRTEEENFTKFRNDKLDPIIEDLKKVVEEIAKQEGYAFIFKRSDLAYGDPKYDITQKVIDKLNKPSQ